MEFKVIIAGTRTFNDYILLKNKMDILLSNKILKGYKITIVSGGARGADRLGERYAKEKQYELVIFNAEWDKYGKKAGYKRNLEMGIYADALVAFWDGKSKGTKNMIEIMEHLEKEYRVIEY